MTVEYQKVWTTMNDLEMVTSKICSAREIIDNAVDKIQGNEYDKAELLMTAAYEFLEYYLQEFDDKFKLAWQATVGDLRDGDKEAYDTVMKEREYYEGKNNKSWNSFWEEMYYPEEYKDSTVSSVQYTEEELNAMCDKAASDEEKEKCREYNLREAEYYDKRVKFDAEYTKAKIEANSPYNDGWTKEYYQKIVDKYENKSKEAKRWVLPVNEIGDNYFVTFPQDLLEAANLKEGDQIQWVDNNDGTYTLRKNIKYSPNESYDDFENPLAMDEC